MNSPRKNVEAVISKWLRTYPSIEEAVGRHVYTVLPKTSKTFPRVLVTRTGGAPEMPALHLDRVALQIEVWADRMVEAEDLAIEIVEALGRLRGQVFNGVAFAHVKTDNVLGSMDPAFSPAKPRIVIDATVWVRH